MVIMIKRSLYMIAILSTISISSIVEVDSMALNDALQSEDIVLDFRNGGEILCNTTNGENLCSCHEYINNKDYVYSNNTYFLPVNNLPVLTNICKEDCISKIHILASIKGNSNISLQEYIPSIQNCKSNKYIFDSIMFCGDNSNFNGTLLLNSTITSITFENEESVISNINVSNIIYNKCKDQYKPQFPRMIDLCLPDNSYFGTLNITGDIMVVLSSENYKPVHISFNKINVPHNTLFVHDKVKIDSDHSNYKYNCSNNYNCQCHCNKILRDINISSENFEALEVPFKHNFLLHEDMKNQIIIELKQYMYNLIKISDKYRDNEVDIDILRESIRELQRKLRTIQNVTDTSDIQELESNITELKIQINNIKKDIGTLNDGGPDLQTQINNKLQGGSGPVEPGDTQTQCTCGTDISKLKAAIGDVTKIDDVVQSLQNQIGKVKTETNTNKIIPLQNQIDVINDSIGTNQTSIKELSKAIGGSETLSYSNKSIDERITTLEKKPDCNCSSTISDLKNTIGSPSSTTGASATSATGLFKKIETLKTQITNITSSSGGGTFNKDTLN